MSVPLSYHTSSSWHDSARRPRRHWLWHQRTDIYHCI